MPRGISIAFVILGTVALLMCGVLIYFGKGKWVAIILGIHALVALLWYSIRAVRPYRSDLPDVANSYPPPSEHAITAAPKLVTEDWTLKPPPQRDQSADRFNDKVSPVWQPVQKDWTLQPPPARDV